MVYGPPSISGMVREPYKVPIRDIIVDKTVDAMTVKTDHLSFLHGPNQP